MAIAIQDVVKAVNYLNLVAQETAIDISQVKLGTEHLNQAAQNLKSYRFRLHRNDCWLLTVDCWLWVKKMKIARIIC